MLLAAAKGLWIRVDRFLNFSSEPHPRLVCLNGRTEAKKISGDQTTETKPQLRESARRGWKQFDFPLFRVGASYEQA